MQRIRAKDTVAEIKLRKALWHLGVRYRKNARMVFGIPDISIARLKIAVFCDGEFWHGKKYLGGEVPKHNRGFWIGKLKKNIERDKIVNRKLKNSGWKVIRFWEKEVLKNPAKAAIRIARTVEKRRS